MADMGTKGQAQLQLVVRNSSGQLLALLRDGHFKTIQRLTTLLAMAVWHSFKLRPMNNPTENEVSRRFNIALEFTKQLRFDAGWSIMRIEDHLPQLIMLYLDGGLTDMQLPDIEQFETDSMWFPSDDVSSPYVVQGDESDWLETT